MHVRFVDKTGRIITVKCTVDSQPGRNEDAYACEVVQRLLNYAPASELSELPSIEGRPTPATIGDIVRARKTVKPTRIERTRKR